MSENEKKQKLVKFLDRKAFDPVLHTSADKYKSESEKRMLEDIQRSTSSEKDRFHHYKSASEVRMRYLDDLTSSAAKKKNSELKSPGATRSSSAN